MGVDVDLLGGTHVDDKLESEMWYWQADAEYENGEGEQSLKYKQAVIWEG